MFLPYLQQFLKLQNGKDPMRIPIYNNMAFGSQFAIQYTPQRDYVRSPLFREFQETYSGLGKSQDTDRVFFHARARSVVDALRNMLAQVLAQKGRPVKELPRDTMVFYARFKPTRIDIAVHDSLNEAVRQHLPEALREHLEPVAEVKPLEETNPGINTDTAMQAAVHQINQYYHTFSTATGDKAANIRALDAAGRIIDLTK